MYHKLGQVLQIRAIITNLGITVIHQKYSATLSARRNFFHFKFPLLFFHISVVVEDSASVIIVIYL